MTWFGLLKKTKNPTFWAILGHFCQIRIFSKKSGSVTHNFEKKQLCGPFLLRMGFNCLKATATSMRQFTYYHSVPRNSWYSFYRPRMDERLSRPWSHPVILITGPLDWESSALTTRPLLHEGPIRASNTMLSFRKN